MILQLVWRDLHRDTHQINPRAAGLGLACSSRPIIVDISVFARRAPITRRSRALVPPTEMLSLCGHFTPASLKNNYTWFPEKNKTKHPSHLGFSVTFKELLFVTRGAGKHCISRVTAFCCVCSVWQQRLCPDLRAHLRLKLLACPLTTRPPHVIVENSF